MNGELRLTRPRRYVESSLQRAVVTFLRWSLPQEVVFFSVPNSGVMRPSEAARMVGEGLKAGVPDLCLISAGCAIFLELKTEAGRLSAVQKQVHAKLSEAGASVFVCRSIDEVAARLGECGVRLRGRLAMSG